MLRRVLTLPRSASADGYDEHVQCDDIASLSSETKRRKAAGVRRIVIPGRPWQIRGYLRGYTRGPHQKLLGCGKALFYGAFSKPF